MSGLLCCTFVILNLALMDWQLFYPSWHWQLSMRFIPHQGFMDLPHICAANFFSTMLLSRVLSLAPQMSHICAVIMFYIILFSCSMSSFALESCYSMLRILSSLPCLFSGCVVHLSLTWLKAVRQTNHLGRPGQRPWLWRGTDRM